MAFKNWFSKNKYGNRKVDGKFGIFDSKHEQDVYLKLLALVSSGRAKNLNKQVSFVVVPTSYEKDGVIYDKKVKGSKLVMKNVRYIADFTYIDTETGKLVVVDAKSEATKRDKVYVIKKKLMLSVHGILIKEM